MGETVQVTVWIRLKLDSLFNLVLKINLENDFNDSKDELQTFIAALVIMAKQI